MLLLTSAARQMANNDELVVSKKRVDLVGES